MCFLFEILSTGTQILFAFCKMRRLGTTAATAVRLVAFWVVAFAVCCSNKYIVRCVDTMSPPADCSIQFNQLAPCVPFVIGDAAAPSDACCKAIGDVASKSAVCLCMLVNSPLSPSTSTGDGGGGFNVTLAFMLPSLCKVPADSSQCRDLLNNKGPESGPSSPTSRGTIVGGPELPKTTAATSLPTGAYTAGAVRSSFTWFSSTLGFGLFAVLLICSVALPVYG